MQLENDSLRGGDDKSDPSITPFDLTPESSTSSLVRVKPPEDRLKDLIYARLLLQSNSNMGKVSSVGALKKAMLKSRALMILTKGKIRNTRLDKLKVSFAIFFCT